MAKPKIFRRKPAEAFEAIQFTGEPGNANTLLKWTQGKGWGSCYRAPVPARIIDGHLSNEIPEGLGVINPAQPDRIYWLELGDWLTFGQQSTFEFSSLKDEYMIDRYEEV